MRRRMDGYASLSDGSWPNFRFMIGASPEKATAHDEAADVEIGYKKYSCVDGIFARPLSLGNDVLLAGYVGRDSNEKR
jgi:hypothetical protein